MNYQLHSGGSRVSPGEASGISVHILGRSIRISESEISCLEGEGNYTYVHTVSGKKYMVSKTMKSLTADLGSNFVRIHKSYLINFTLINERLGDERMLRMSGGKEVMISRRKAKEIAARLNA